MRIFEKLLDIYPFAMALLLVVLILNFTPSDQPNPDYTLELRPDELVEVQTKHGEVFTINLEDLEDFIEKDNL